MADWKISVIADIEDFKKKLIETGAVGEKQAARLASAYGSKMIRMQGDVGKAARGAATTAKKSFGEAFDAIDRGANKTFIGGILGDMKDVAEGFAALGPAGAIAAVTVASVGVAAAGAVVSVGALAVGAVKLVSIADDLAKELEHLEDIDGFGISADKLESIHNANAAMQGLRDVGKQVALTAAGEIAPSVERVSTVLLAMALAGVDAFNHLGERGDAVGEVIRALLVNTILPGRDSFFELAEAAINVAKVFDREVPASVEKWVASNREGKTTLDEVGEGFTRLEFELGDYMDQARAVIGENRNLATAGRDVAASNREQIDTQRELNDIFKSVVEINKSALDSLATEQEKAAQGWQKQFDELDHARKALEAVGLSTEQVDVAWANLTAALSADLDTSMLEDLEGGLSDVESQIATTTAEITEITQTFWEKYGEDIETAIAAGAQIAAPILDSFSAITDAVAEYHQGRLDQIREERAAAIGALDEEREAILEKWDTASVAEKHRLQERLAQIEVEKQAERKAANELAKQQKKALKAAFAAQKAAAVVRIAIDSAQAAIALIPAFAFLGPAAPAAAAGVAGIAGAIQAGIVLAQKPPTFHTGKVGGGNNGVAPDEMLANLRQDERVLTARGTAAIGGDAVVAAANRGSGPAAPNVTVIIGGRAIKHEVREMAEEAGFIRGRAGMEGVY